MLSTIKHLLSQRNNKENNLNILTFPTHERYQSGFADLPHTFYMYQGEHIKNWSHKYGKIPNNHILLPRETLPLDVTFDLVLSQNKFGQFPVAHKISKSLGIPLINLEHTLPPTDWTPDIMDQVRSMTGDLNVFISEYSIDKWGYEHIPNSIAIHHMVDTEIFKPFEEPVERMSRFLSVVNLWKDRDYFCGYKVWERLSQGLPTLVVGDNPGWTKPTNSIEELSSIYASSKFFLNTSLVSPVPTSLLEAMASGCICISTATCMIPEIIEDGVNGFISNDESVLRKRCEEVLANPTKYEYMGINARNTILKHFNKASFLSNWDKAFRSVL